jgi:hypothetical protein
MTPHFQAISFETRVQTVQTRMPFRYGAAKLERCPHLFLIVTIRDKQGREAQGIAADNLPPKWFDKAPAKTYTQEIQDQILVLRWAMQAALAQPPATAFDLWRTVYHDTQQQAAAAGLPPLLGGFGPSLVERAINDALGNLLDMPFHRLLHTNAPGINFGALDAQLRDVEPAQILPPSPLSHVWARHTVGLSDPIRTSDIGDGERLYDGLPQSLEEVVSFYGARYFKIKVQNSWTVI